MRRLDRQWHPRRDGATIRATPDRVRRGGMSIAGDPDRMGGTFGDIAPEQFRMDAAPRRDLDGLGATAIALLSRRSPESMLGAGTGSGSVDGKSRYTTGYSDSFAK